MLAVLCAVFKTSLLLIKVSIRSGFVLFSKVYVCYTVKTEAGSAGTSDSCVSGTVELKRDCES